MSKKLSVCLSLQQNSGQNRNMKITSKSFENVATFKRSVTQLAGRNIVRGRTKSRLGWGNIHRHSMQKSFFCPVFEGLKQYSTQKYNFVRYLPSTWVCKLVFFTLRAEAMGPFKQDTEEDILVLSLRKWKNWKKALCEATRYVVLAVTLACPNRGGDMSGSFFNMWCWGEMNERFGGVT